MLYAPANPDHSATDLGQDVVTGYAVQLTRDGSTTPLPEFDLGKPPIVPACVVNDAPATNCIARDIDTYVKSLQPGTYRATLRAYGPGGSGVSPSGAPFALRVRAPGQQAAPGITRSVSP